MCVWRQQELDLLAIARDKIQDGSSGARTHCPQLIRTGVVFSANMRTLAFLLASCSLHQSCRQRSPHPQLACPGRTYNTQEQQKENS